MRKSRYTYLFASILLFLLGLQADAQGVIPTKGTDFWLGYMSNYQDETEPELSVFVVADQNTSGMVSIPGLGMDIPFSVTANNTTTVALPSTCEHFSSEVVENLGIHITTADTVSVFAINFKELTADGTKVLPIQSTGTDYTISAYSGLPGTSDLASEFLIVASEDDTEVEIIPTAPTQGGQAAGVPFTVSLDAGQSYQVKANAGNQDFMGTRIVATPASGNCRPFSVFSGSVCANVPANCNTCDHIYEQNFPTTTWGESFFVVPFDLVESCTYRVMARDNGTQVFVDGVSQGIVNAGNYLEFNSILVEECVTATGPISVTQYMEGTQCVSGFSDPAMLILNDSNQKINNVTFSTVVSPNITQHSVSIIVESGAIGTVTLDNTVIDPALFTTFSGCPDHAWAKFPLSEGSHTLDSPTGFTAYIYGLGASESYAYSVGSFAQEELLEIVDSQLCTDLDATLYAPPGYFNVYWYAQTDPETVLSNEDSLVLDAPITSDVYVAVGLDAAGCEEENLFLVESLEGLDVDISPESAAICKFESVQLSSTVEPLSDVYAYNWTPAIDINDANSPNPVVTPLESRWYYLEVTGPTGCGYGIDSVFIDVSPGAASGLEAMAEPTQICVGEDVNLSADIEEVIFEDDFDPNISLGLWSNISNGIASQDCGSVSGEALYFDGNGERSVTSNSLDLTDGGSIHFSLKIGSDVAPCDDADPGENIVLEYSTNGGTDWTLIQLMVESSFEQFTTITSSIPDDAQTANTILRWRQITHSGIGQDNWALDNIFVGVVNLDVFTFSWSPAGTITSPDQASTTANPITNTTYFIEVSDNVFGCTYEDSVFVEVGQLFGVDITPDTTLCDLSGMTLNVLPDAPGDYDYEWNDPSGTLSTIYSSNPTANPTTSTTYEVTITSSQGCSTSASVTVNVDEILDLDITTDNATLCDGISAQLNAFVNGGQPLDVTYEWSPADGLDDALIPNPIASPSLSTTYVLTVTNASGICSVQDSIFLEVTSPFTIDAGNDTELCSTEGYELSASNTSLDPLTWSWESAELLSDADTASPIINTDTTATYYVTGTDPTGCIATDSVTISFTFNGFDLGPDTLLCAGDALTLSTGYLTFDHEWSTTEVMESIDVDVTDTYSVIVTDPIGCIAYDTITVTFSSFPNIDLGEDMTGCIGDDFLLDPQGDPLHDYEWSTSADTPTITVDTDGDYSVIVTNEAGCQSFDTVSVAVVLPPVSPLPPQQLFCSTENIILDAGVQDGMYTWNDNSTDPTLVVSTGGVFWVDITIPPGCTIRDSIEVIAFDPPISLLEETIEACEGDALVLDTGIDPMGNAFSWSTGSNDDTTTVFESGTYSVEVSNGVCGISDEVDVVFQPAPSRPFDSRINWCFAINGETLLLDALNEGSSYLWSDGSIAQTLPTLDYGDYSVLITDPSGCEALYSSTVVEDCFNDQIFVPNAFTPDGDGINDVFLARGFGIASFEMIILDRWGRVVFESTDIDEAWVGEVNDGSHYNDNNIYSYSISYTVARADGSESDPIQIQGFVTLIR